MCCSRWVWRSFSVCPIKGSLLYVLPSCCSLTGSVALILFILTIMIENRLICGHGNSVALVTESVGFVVCHSHLWGCKDGSSFSQRRNVFLSFFQVCMFSKVFHIQELKVQLFYYSHSVSKLSVRFCFVFVVNQQPTFSYTTAKEIISWEKLSSLL